MILICPKPGSWAEVYKRLEHAWRNSGSNLESPPVPLILSGWHYSSDIDKQRRWQETLEWAERHAFGHLIPNFRDEELFFTEQVSTSYPEQHYRPDRYSVRERSSAEVLATAMQILNQKWSLIAGPELCDICSPIKFSGRKARRLAVAVIGDSPPPWGDWAAFPEGADRTSFSDLRSRVNRTIAPHHVDHIDFLVQRPS